MDSYNQITSYFDQSKQLRRSGFRTKINSLPEEVREYVDELLKEDRTDVFIAFEVNRRYDLSHTSHHGELSHKAVASYRKVWQKHQLNSTASLRTLVNFDKHFIEDFKRNIEKIAVISRMCELFQQQYEAVQIYAEREKQLPIPLQGTETARKTCFTMGVQLVDMLIDTGLITKAIAEKQQNQKEPEMPSSDLLAATQRILKEIKGRQEDIEKAKKDQLPN